jgi:hypothetical protein
MDIKFQVNAMEKKLHHAAILNSVNSFRLLIQYQNSKNITDQNEIKMTNNTFITDFTFFCIALQIKCPWNKKSGSVKNRFVKNIRTKLP